MGWTMRLIRIVGLFGVLAFVGFVLPRLGPDIPERPTGVAVGTTASRTAQPETMPELPPDFPSMEYPPPENEVPDGEPIPIDTKFGISYTVPGDWKNSSRGVAGWSGDLGTVTYGAVAMYGYDYCPEYRDGARKAMTGMTGRNGVDVATAAFDASREAEIIFRETPGDNVKIDYSDPVEFEIDGARAVRYSVRAAGIPRRNECDSTTATFDVVAISSSSTASVAVFMVHTLQQVDDPLTDGEVQHIIDTLHRK